MGRQFGECVESVCGGRVREREKTEQKIIIIKQGIKAWHTANQVSTRTEQGKWRNSGDDWHPNSSCCFLIYSCASSLQGGNSHEITQHCR